MPTIVGRTHLERFLREVAGVSADKSDLDRLTDIVSQKLHDLLIVGVRNASFNQRDVVMEPDLPLTKGLLETMQRYERMEQRLEVEPILQHLASEYPQLDRDLSYDVVNKLPDLVAALMIVAVQLVRLIDPNDRNPDTKTWDRVFQAMRLTL